MDQESIVHQDIIRILPCDKNQNKVGSLLLLFQSEFFTLDMLILYLYRKFAESGIRDFLINKLYNRPITEIDFYMPQICYIAIKRDSYELEKYLLDHCASSISQYYKISWLMLSFGETNRKDKHKMEKVDQFIKNSTLSMLNGRLIDETLKWRYQWEYLKIKNIYDEQEKDARRDFLDFSKKFISNLIKISLTLKSIAPEDRKEKLKSYIKFANHKLESNFHHKIMMNYHQLAGVYLPFQTNPNSSLIMRILETDFACFNTKKRVPYKIVVETVDFNDLKDSNFINSSLELESPSMKIKSGTSGMDWDLTETDVSENPLNNTPSSEDLTKIKIEKYQGLTTFFKKKLEEEEMKKSIKKPEKQNIWFPEKIKEFLNIMKIIPTLNDNNENINQKKSIILDNNDFSQEIPNPSQKEILSQLLKRVSLRRNSDPGHASKEENVSNLVLQRMTLCKVPTSSQWIDLEKIQKPKHQRRLSFKKVESKEVVTFLNTLKQENNEKQKEGVLDKILMKFEEETGKQWPWDELWIEKSKKIKENSNYGHLPSYKLRTIIVKGGDDLRQELIAMQIILKFQSIFQEAGLNLYLRPYEIIVTSHNSGILEFVPDTLSLDGLKKKYPGKTLLEIYMNAFCFDFEEAQKNFIESLAAYSLICYVLQIKDRHNGNILIDAYGHIIHIDFGFMLAISPGGINFESAPFKLTNDYVDLLGGRDSQTFTYFKILLMQGFMELRKRVDSITFLLEIMMEESDLPCFPEFDLAVFRSRFLEKSTDKECLEYVEKLIYMSIDNWRTAQYDNFQKITNGIAQ